MRKDFGQSDLKLVLRYDELMKRYHPYELSYLTPKQWREIPLNLLRFDLKRSWLNDCLDQVKAELKQKNIKPFFHAWVSDEWFSPDGCPGIAIPYYLFHPALIKLNKQNNLPVEGVTKTKALQLIRHEVGHAIENAWRLRRKKTRQQLFGLSSTRYPEIYTPCPRSTDYVEHLGEGYSQSHPDEDWAETFALWLSTSKRTWNKKYKGTKALEKLLYCETLMSEIAGTKPLNSEKFVVSPIEDRSITVGQLIDRNVAARAKTVVKAVRMTKKSPIISNPDILKQAHVLLEKKGLGFLM
tara:strand:- start:250 stop:1140 length:891 start_codon:yes stop_codon:yes gene_type:complete